MLSVQVRIRTLGAFCVQVDGEDVPDRVWKKQKARQLLKCLLSQPHRRLSTDEAIEYFWPDAPDFDAAQKTLRSTLSALRSALGATGAGRGRGLVVTHQGAVIIPPDVALWVDADEFEQTLARAQADPNPLELLELADRLYQDHYLPDDRYEAWTEGRRESLRRQWIELQHRLASAREAMGNGEEASAALLSLLRDDPADERAARALMRQLAGQGQRSEALRVHERLLEALTELGISPEAETTALRSEIALGQPQGALVERPPSQAPASARMPQRAPLPRQEPRQFSPSYPFSIPDQLVGRLPELNRLERTLEKGRDGLEVVLLSAPAGTGKSALAGALVRRALRLGYFCLAGGAYDQQGALPLGPFRDALADYLLSMTNISLESALQGMALELAEVVPELRQRLPLTQEQTPNGLDQARLFGAIHSLLRDLATETPVLLCLEDLHAADAASLDLIRFITRQARRLPLVLALTFRDDEVQPTDPLSQLRAVLLREGAEAITLAPLPLDDASRMIDVVLRGPVSPRLSRQLHHATGGNPLFLEQFILALKDDGKVDYRDGMWQTSGSIGDTLPEMTRALLGQRLNHLSPRCRSTVSVAAILGHEVDHEALATVIGDTDSAALLDDLDEALRAHILHESSRGYVFAHGLLRETIYQSLSGPRRAALHARAGAVLEARLGAGQRERTGELAYHFTRAGNAPELRAKALQYSVIAGRQAAALYSHREALRHFSAAEAILESNDTVEPDVRAEVLFQRARSARSLGLWPLALSLARSCAPLLDDGLMRAEAYEMSGFALQQTFHMAEALEEYHKGLAVLESVQPGPEAERARLRIQQQQAQIWYMRGQGHSLIALGDDMLASAQRTSEPEALIAAHATHASGSILIGDIAEGIRSNSAARDLARDFGDGIELAIRESNLAVDHFLGGHVADAIEGFERAVRMCREAAAEYRAVNSLLWLGRARLADGDLAGARHDAELALRLALESGVRFTPDCHDVVGLVRIAEANWEGAEACFREALSLRHQTDHLAGCINSLLGLGTVHEHRGDDERARECYVEALGLAELMDPSPYLVATRRALGQLRHRLGETAEANAMLESALAVAKTMQGSTEYAVILLTAAELNWQGLSVEARIARANEALELGLPSALMIEANALLAMLHAREDRRTEAAACAERARVRADQFGVDYLRGIAQAAALAISALENAEAPVLAQRLDTALDSMDRASSVLGAARVLRIADECGALTNATELGLRHHVQLAVHDQ